MFANRNATAMLPAKDLERARRWYEDKLGLKPKSGDENGATYELNGVRAFLYKSDFAGTAQSTMLSLASPDLVADVKALRAKGVKFLDYDLPGFKTVDGIAEFGTVKNAWAKDFEGNILGFVQGSFA